MAADSAFITCYLQPCTQQGLFYSFVCFCFPGRSSATSWVSRISSQIGSLFPCKTLKPCDVLPDGRELFPFSVPHHSVLLPIFPCKQEAALLNIISIESKWCLCLISSGLRLYQQAHCWSCICSLEYFRALESDRFMFITLNHSIIDSPKCYFPRWQEAVRKKTQRIYTTGGKEGKSCSLHLDRASEGLILLLFRAWSCLCSRKWQSCGRRARLIHSDDAEQEKPLWNHWD